MEKTTTDNFLNKYIGKETFEINYVYQNFYTVSFMWSGIFMAVSWDSILEQINGVTPSYLEDNIDMNEVSDFIKQNIFY